MLVLMMPVQQDIYLEDGGDVCMHYLPLPDEVIHPCTLTFCLHHLCFGVLMPSHAPRACCNSSSLDKPLLHQYHTRTWLVMLATPCVCRHVV